MIMSKTNEDVNTKNAEKRFWEAYRPCVEANRVRPDHSAFYVRWAKVFSNHFPGKILQERTAEDVEAFLSHSGSQPHLAE